MGRVWKLLGLSWVVLEALFFMLVFGMVFKSALGGVWLGFWLDFIDLGRILGRFWDGLGRVWCRLLGLLGLFWKLFFSFLYLEWSSKVLLEASGLDFGSVLMGLGRILGGF